MNSAVAVGDLTDISEYDSNALYIVLYNNGYVILCSRIAMFFHHVNVEDYMLTIHETVSIS